MWNFANWPYYEKVAAPSGRRPGGYSDLRRASRIIIDGMGNEEQRCYVQYERNWIAGKGEGTPIFCIKNKKSGAIPGKSLEKTLTNEKWYATMVLHSVLLCPIVPILICTIIISQIMAPVKWEKLKISTHPGVSIYKQHINSGLGQKKGCEERYGNGQGHDVRQDHA